MITMLLNAKKFIPDEYQKSIYNVDYAKLYEEGYRLILTDLDNTLVSYDDELPTQELFDLKERLENMGFEIIIVSNNHKKRVGKFANEFNVNFASSALKPLKFGFKRALRKASRKYKKEEILVMGDQLMTDMYGAKRSKYYGILIQAVKRKTEKWVTRFNRNREIKILKKIEKKYDELYEERLKEYWRVNYGD